MWSLGEMPYNWLQPVDMIDHLHAGHRLGQPEHAGEAM
jgi:hypothetical protein